MDTKKIKKSLSVFEKSEASVKVNFALFNGAHGSVLHLIFFFTIIRRSCNLLVAAGALERQPPRYAYTMT
jgi:hypothetical protein